MDIIVEKAEINHIPKIEKIAKGSFEKFRLDELGLEYDQKTLFVRLEEMVKSEGFIVLVAKISDEVEGFIICTEMQTLYSESMTQIVEIAMQPNPNLSYFKQSKVLLSLMKTIEAIADESGIDIVAFSICPQFDISQNLEKKGYKLSDKIYIKKRGEE
jgi:hypothetical protein